MVCGLMYSCLVYLWNEQKSVSRHEQKLATQSIVLPTHLPTFSKDLARKFAELGLSCKLPLEKGKKKKSLEDAPNCDIMPLSQNNIEWSSYLILTSWIKVLSSIASCCHSQVMLDNFREKKVILWYLSIWLIKEKIINMCYEFV